jgi:hypothetical protein
MSTQFPRRPDICIFHSPCNDGFAAAWAVWSRFGDYPEYMPMQHGQRPLPDPLEYRDQHILFVDFSLPLSDLEVMAKDAASITILDHHATAAAALVSLPPMDKDLGGISNNYDPSIHPEWATNVRVGFDMEHSGAALAWQYIQPGKPIPRLIHHVQGRDLWLKDDDMHDMVHAVVGLRLSRHQNLSDQFEAFSRLSHEIEASPDAIVAEAEILADQRAMFVAQIAETAIDVNIAGHVVPVVSAPYALVSDVCHALLKEDPKAPFAAAVVHAYGNTNISMRSDNDRLDVGCIAATYGGGGHRNAAGFQAPWFLWPMQIENMAASLEDKPLKPVKLSNLAIQIADMVEVIDMVMVRVFPELTCRARIDVEDRPATPSGYKTAKATVSIETSIDGKHIETFTEAYRVVRQKDGTIPRDHVEAIISLACNMGHGQICPSTGLQDMVDA